MAETTGKKWSTFLSDSGLSDEVTKNDYVVIFRSSVDGAVIDGTGENKGVALNNISLYKKVSILSGLLKNAGSNPIDILPSPGIGKFYSIQRVVLSRSSGGSPYDFDDYLALGTNGGDAQFLIDNGLFNTPIELNLDLIKQGQIVSSGVPYILYTIGNNASQGDKDIDIEIFYSIHLTKL